MIPTYFSPAKLNLFFRVLSKRMDGFHEIASIYQAIDLGDFLSFEPFSKDSLTLTDPSLPTDERNLIIKARDLFRKKTGILKPMRIHVQKNIPSEAGLGGGSSNAATTLFALNELSGFPLNRKDLIEIGKGLGSDVSFFFSSGLALCSGRGEIFEDWDSPYPFRGYLYKPSFGLSTAKVYNNTEIDQLPKRDLDTILSSFLTKNPMYFNDLEIAATAIEPRLHRIKQKLLDKFDQVVMTGSGSAFFCLKNHEEIKNMGVKIKGISRSKSWYNNIEPDLTI